VITTFRRRSRATTPTFVLMLAFLVISTVACAGDEEAIAATLQPLTPPQAMRMAQTLHQNHEAGGATFRIAARDVTTGETISLEGVVDWSTLRGRASVQGYSDERGQVIEIAWTKDAVAELRPALAAALTARGEPPDSFVLRPIDINDRPLDRLIALVSGLAVAQPDNAQLIVQNPGSGFVRADTLRGVDVEVLRYSSRTLLWIESASGRLLRFEGTSSTGEAPVVVDLFEVGRFTVDLPLVSDLALE